MAGECALTPQAREDLIRRAWYAHDARWFAAAAAQFGIEAANRLNREAVRALGHVEAGRLARALGVSAAGNIEDLIGVLETALDLYVPPPLMEVSFAPVDGRSYEVRVSQCFAAANIKKAGIADSYECAVFDRFEGYHNVMGLPLADGQLPSASCAIAAGRECSRVLRIREEGEVRNDS